MTIYRGGSDLERLYLEDLTFIMNGEEVVVKATDIPGVNMADLIARHKGRYALCGLFLRPGMRMLDFPCGSGYGAKLLELFDPIYEGWDSDLPTVMYAQQIYETHKHKFYQQDIMNFRPNQRWNLIACIEGLEHIEQKYQAPLIEAFYKALKPGGTLIVSCPMAQEKSGPNPDNPYHLCELTRFEFDRLLLQNFLHVEIVTKPEVLSTGKKQTMMFGICHKES